MKEQQFTVYADDHDIRLDRWFKRHYPNLPQVEVQKACRKGLIRIGGKKAQHSDHVQCGNEISIKYMDLNVAAKTAAKKTMSAELTEREIEETQSWVIAKHPEYIAVNKPAGVAVQGGSGVSDHLDRRLPALQFDAKEKPKLVHRLDKDTSGVLLLARSVNHAALMSHFFATKRLKKIYWALVVGVPEIYEGEIEGAMQKGGDEGMEKMQLDEEGKHAVTAYRVIEALSSTLALVELQPITGRTHQLRVHMAEMGNPILGDGKYGGKAAFIDGIDLPKQLHLHARQIISPDLFGGIDVTAPLPKHMQLSFKKLGINRS